MVTLDQSAKLAFLHIPKTGGISVERAVARALPDPEATCPTYYVPDYIGKTFADMPDYRFYKGHFDFDFLKSVPEDYVRAVVLRHPIDRTLSICNHIASRPKHALHDQAKGVPLAEFLGSNPQLGNQMTQYILGTSRFDALLAAPIPKDEKIQRAGADAVTNLASFDVIGVTARLNRFIRDLAQKTGLAIPAPKVENTNAFITFKSENLDAADKAMLRQVTWLDRPVYQTLWARFLDPEVRKTAL